jgi:ureidoglycolate lyase
LSLKVEALESEAFAPFGQVVDLPRGQPDAEGDPWRWWARTALVDQGERPYAVGYLAVEPSRTAFDRAERHLRSEELVAPLTGEILLYVAAPDPDAFRVFRVCPGQAVVLARGVWHGAPLVAAHPAHVLVLLAEGAGTSDIDKVQFEELVVESEA